MKTFKHKFLIAAVLTTGLSCTSCEDLWDPCIKGNGDAGIEHRTLQPFSRVEINGNFDVQIDTGYGPVATVETDENLMDFVVTHVSGDKLIVETRNNNCIEASQPIQITIGTDALNEITLSGSGLVYCYGLKTDELTLKVSGSGQINCRNAIAKSTDIELEGSGIVNCELVAESVSAQLEGSGEIRLQGDCVTADHVIIGSGKIKAGQLNTDVCVVDISGSGIVDTHVNNALDVTIIGSGLVYYSGNPTLVSYISGSGKVIER